LGAVLIPLNCYWVTLCEIVWPTVHATVLSLFFNVVFTLFLVCLANLVLGRWAPRHALRPAELLVVYAMLSGATSLFGHDMLQILFPLMNYAGEHATLENDWAALIHPHLPDWLTVSEASAHRGYYDGQSSFFDPKTLRAWAVPLTAWAAFIATLYFVFLCINTLIRRQWTEHEILRMHESRLFRNRYMWWGFGLAAGLDVWNGVATLWPVLPFARLRWELAPLFHTRPWNGITWLPVRVYPFAVGLAYFMPLDLAFSTWFFHLYWKGTEVLREAVGAAKLSGAYLSDQSAGAWLGLGLSALWKARHALAETLRSARANDESPDEPLGEPPDEPMSHRVAWLGILRVRLLGRLHDARRRASVGVGVFHRGLLPAIPVAHAHAGRAGSPDARSLLRRPGAPNRVRGGHAAVGSPRPDGILPVLLSDARLPLPPDAHQLETYKLAEAVNASRRRLTVAMIVASIVGILPCYQVILPLFYHYGSSARVTGFSGQLARESYVRLESWPTQPKGPDWAVMRQLGGGFGLTVGLMALRQRFVWFPFHPVGFAVAGSWTMSWMWFSVFLSWGLKLTILRSGGIGLYRRLAPFFIGLALGQYLVGSLWTIIGAALGKKVYGFFVG
jgi:hypothetical protein